MSASNLAKPIITNIDISKDYDETQGSDDIHYQTFGRLAAFFGRDMQAHRHDGFFQLHYLVTGQIELQLEEQRYSVQAPLFILTPPSVPHAFFTQEDTDGHVLTVRQELITPLLSSLYPTHRELVDIPAICLSVADKPDELEAFNHYWALIERESVNQFAGREQSLAFLAQSLFTFLLRSIPLEDHHSGGVRGELKLFQRFNQLVDQHFHQHLAVPDYAKKLRITESRLKDMCRRFANRPPKRLIFDRQLREAKRLLLFSDSPVFEIAYQLGFKDPAYFARFFNRLVGCSPSGWREKNMIEK
ncbi:4-hydroxyphenylacetate catabolism regulatory protein HpaA [Xenorhabdus nematophila]|uniref:Regulator of the 4HPA-hydroxylase operon n=1 Tax=Xenorhabdus nematophila (strain ATCC 19061 / DSM 3370 / CCUG 14189 / LMG 1036 / NCIMB 9965 / AN6) TaxID=406817 RepID=D3VKD3_XENNA|nr:4-hydroxyphenylacetate catabolism regulatory protein HpaA [Xenorhabdus nematophila]CEF30422.1 Regulator of the 4HPA-hydroxylase operon [Xenorhabdus nematophila str. Websteri]AYA41100.1 4-hydroxyphenylacetate catabolism regulatory protein HpaA [Xenorhabdus nematophila]MBA0019850.1 4-hydroxyphenylacetate catabolism regulatory protein HpaA [Xenorhabdus nematophila]MCB4426429.1 4-hydroxyphenylacetate catabolism regulatory protein HpaA [Xenorhabdus nematophila]QNJ35501.1 4-hydroxyphenylacetate c